ncbi:hypothetical protein SASPL_124451 [Salvia splendens]|uniref:OTU domain-containing protein n=1 Tax=Salvia splendens TaxID=180675 RepID=A0A8X8XN93_SALSN|nr:hypothetical protein SASPL_124451 [Salvia splendens]
MSAANSASEDVEEGGPLEALHYVEVDEVDVVGAVEGEVDGLVGGEVGEFDERGDGVEDVEGGEEVVELVAVKIEVTNDTEDDHTIAEILAEEEKISYDNRKLGKRLSHLDSIPHTPRVIGDIPDPNDATLDHERLAQRLATYSLAEMQIEGDGNCQFRALADQLYQNPDYHKFVRKQVIKQACRLKRHKRLYESYVPMRYKHYVRKMKRLGEWGDHVTLQAAADRFEAKICLITSFRDTGYIEILPNNRSPCRARVTLAKAVLVAIPNYCMQIGMVPVSICKEIERLVRRFIWGGSDEQRKTSLVGWKSVCQPLTSGGLGLRRLKRNNEAFMIKLGFNLVAKKNEFWVRILREKYKVGVGCPSSISRPGSSFIWRSLMKLGPLIRHKIDNSVVDLECLACEMVDGHGEWKWGAFRHFISSEAAAVIAGIRPPYEELL